MRIGAHHPAIHAQRLYLCPHAIQPDLHIAIRLEMIHRAVDRPLSTRTQTPSKRASRTSQEQPRESGEDAAFGKCQPAPQAANAGQPLRAEPLFLQRGQVLLVEMVVLLHEEHIRHTKYQQHANQISPVPRGRGGNEDHPGADRELQQHIKAGHQRMLHPQLIGHQLVSVLAMRLAQGLVQHDLVADGQHGVHAAHGQEHDIREIARLQHQASQQEHHDERGAHAADIPRETLRLALRAEIEEAEHQDRQQRHINQALRREIQLTINPQHREQQRERIATADPVDTIHEIICVDDAHTHDQPQRHHPPVLPAQNPPAIKHQQHRQQMNDQANADRQRMHIIPQTHAGNQQQTDQERQIRHHRLPAPEHRQERRPDNHGDRDHHAAPAQHHLRVRTARIRHINNLLLTRYAEIQKLRYEQNRNNNEIYHFYRSLHFLELSVKLQKLLNILLSLL